MDRGGQWRQFTAKGDLFPFVSKQSSEHLRAKIERILWLVGNEIDRSIVTFDPSPSSSNAVDFDIQNNEA